MINIEFHDKIDGKFITCNGIGTQDGSSISGKESDLELFDESLWNQLTKYNTKELKPFFASIYYEQKKYTVLGEIGLNTLIISEYEDECLIHFSIILNILNWSNPFSILEFYELLNKSIKNSEYSSINTSFIDDSLDVSGFDLKIVLNEKETELPLERLINQYVGFFEQEITIIKERILESVQEEIITLLFNFPKGFKSICNQYLIYFGKFMEDIGVDINTSVKEQGDLVLFSVYPIDKKTAISKIYEALKIYLELPNYSYNSNSELSVNANQLMSNILHLKSQVLLKESIIQSKNAAIESLKLSNYQRQQIILEKDKKLQKNNEEVIPGIVSIKKYDGKFLSIDLPEIIRNIKGIFQRKDSK